MGRGTNSPNNVMDGTEHGSIVETVAPLDDSGPPYLHDYSGLAQFGMLAAVCNTSSA